MKLAPGLLHAERLKASVVTCVSARGAPTDWSAQALDMLEQGLALIDSRGVVRKVNQQACNILGYEMHDLLGKSSMLVAPPEIHLQADRFLAGLLNQSPKILGHWIMRHKNGNYLTVQTQFKSCADPEWGACALVTFRLEDKADPLDLARRAQSEREASQLALSHGLLQLVINNVPARIAYFDSQTLRCIFGNESFARAHGLQSKALVNKHADELLTPAAWQLAAPGFKRAALGQATRYEHVEMAPDGQSRYIEVDLLPHFGRSGEQIGIFALATDISSHRVVELALRESQAQLSRALDKEKELGELKTTFVAMASHELRTPLTAVQSSVDLLEHYGDRLDSSTRQEALHDIKDAVHRMVATMENVLTLGRMGHGQAIAVTQDQLQQLLVKIAQETGALHHRPADISVMAAPGTGSTPLLLDCVALRHIAGNLLSNACKYSAANTPVELAWCRIPVANADMLQITVTDHGMGIPLADVPQLFEAFQRASNVGHIQGTGLGLPIVRRAVESLGGSIDVQSTVGQGSCFRVLLPWVDRTPAET